MFTTYIDDSGIRELMPTAGSLGIEPICRLAGVSRTGFYRSLQQRRPEE